LSVEEAQFTWGLRAAGRTPKPSNRTAVREVVRQNIVISLGVILLLVTSALAEKINLTTGVIGHEGNTVMVVLNGLRLLRSRRS
jgi:cation transport ATPase